MDYIIICLLTELIILLAALCLCIVVGLLLTCFTSSPPQKDPLENIRIIGLEARQEMDRIYDDFVLQQVQRLLNSCTNTSYGPEKEVT
jgi:hypothetical protein